LDLSFNDLEEAGAAALARHALAQPAELAPG
jgi:hypothetical protein